MRVDNNPPQEKFVIPRRFDTREGVLFVESGANISLGDQYERWYGLWKLKGIQSGRADFEFVRRVTQEEIEWWSNRLANVSQRFDWSRLPASELPGIDPTDVASVGSSPDLTEYTTAILSDPAAIRWGKDTVRMSCVRFALSYEGKNQKTERQFAITGTAVGQSAIAFGRNGSVSYGPIFEQRQEDFLLAGDKNGNWGPAFPGMFRFLSNDPYHQWPSPKYVESLREFVWWVEIENPYHHEFHSATDAAMLASRKPPFDSCP